MTIINHFFIKDAFSPFFGLRSSSDKQNLVLADSDPEKLEFSILRILKVESELPPPKRGVLEGGWPQAGSSHFNKKNLTL